MISHVHFRTCTILCPIVGVSGVSPSPSTCTLLADVLEQVKRGIETVLSLNKRRSALEEAEYEDDDDEGALEREMMMQCE
jgi:hypothetical protein